MMTNSRVTVPSLLPKKVSPRRYVCTVCGERVFIKDRCPLCGAHMDDLGEGCCVCDPEDYRDY